MSLGNGSEGKESAHNAGDLGLIPGLGKFPGERNGNPLQILAWEIPWTEEPGGLQSMGSQIVQHDCVTLFHFYSRLVNKVKVQLVSMMLANDFVN